MIRNIGAVVAGYASWTVVFLGSAALLRSMMSSVHDDAGVTTDTMALGFYLVASVAASLLAGLAAARIAGAPKTRWVWITAIVLLATGVPVQLLTWDQTPLWFNIAFLVLLVPVTILGGRLGGSHTPSDTT